MELEDYDKAADKLTAALRKPLGEGMIHLSTKILKGLQPHLSTDADFTFQWIHQVVDPWSDVPALRGETRRQLEHLCGRNWDEDSGVANSMMEIVYIGIEYLIKEGKAWNAYRMSRLKTRTTKTTTTRAAAADDDVCCICQELLCKRSDEINVAVLDCGHEFHLPCIKKWLMHSDKNSCPLCKATALEIDPKDFLDSREFEEWIDGDLESLLCDNTRSQF